MLSAGKVEVRVSDYATQICGSEPVGEACRTNVTAQLQGTVTDIENSEPAKIALNSDLEQAFNPVVRQCVDAAQNQIGGTYQTQLDTHNTAVAKYNADKAAYDRDKAAYDAWAAADPATRGIAPWEPEAEPTPPTAPTEPTGAQVFAASSQCIRDTYMASDSPFRNLIAGAATRAKEIQENNFEFKSLGESALKSLAVFCGDNAKRQKAFKGYYKLTTIGMDDTTRQHFDAILLRIALEKKRDGFNFGGFMDDGTKVKLAYMGVEFDCVCTLMKAIASGAYGSASKGVPVEALYIPSSLGEALAKVDGLAGDDAAKKEIYDRAIYLFYETVGRESAASAPAASIKVGDEIALFVNGVLGSTDADAVKLTNLQTAFKTKFLFPKDGGFKAVDVPADFSDPVKLGLAKGAAIPVDLEINLRRLYLKASKDEKDDAGKGKVAAALVDAVKKLKIDNADKLADALATFDAKVKKDDKGAYTVSFDPFTNAPASLLAKLNITDDLRKIAMGFIWDQVVAQTPEGKKPTEFLAALLKSKEFRARSGSADALLLTEVVIGKDGSVKIEALPEGLHAGKSQLDIRDAGAYGAIQTKKKISELYLKSKADKKFTHGDANSKLAVEANRTAVEDAAKDSLAAVVALGYKGWGEKGPDIGPVDGHVVDELNLSLNAQSIDGNTALLVSGSFKKFGDLTDKIKIGVSLGGNVGSGLEQRTAVNDKLLYGPQLGPIGKPNTKPTEAVVVITDGRNSGQFGVADRMFGFGALTHFEIKDENGKPKYTFDPRLRLGKPATLSLDSPIVEKYGQKRFDFKEWTALAAVKASAVWGASKPSLELKYYRSLEGKNPHHAEGTLGAEISLPWGVTAEPGASSTDLLNFSKSTRAVNLKLSRDFLKRGNWTLNGNVSGEQAWDGSALATVSVSSNDDITDTEGNPVTSFNEYGSPPEYTVLGAGATLGYKITDTTSLSFDYFYRAYTVGYEGGANVLTAALTFKDKKPAKKAKDDE